MPQTITRSQWLYYVVLKREDGLKVKPEKKPFGPFNTMNEATKFARNLHESTEIPSGHYYGFKRERSNS